MVRMAMLVQPLVQGAAQQLRLATLPQGLCSLLEDYRHIYQDVRFRDSKLVVDGSSLVHLLYKMADQNPGGEYLAFQAEVQAFFKNLSDLGIKPYVADPAVRLQVCLETLGVEEETLEGVPAHLRLPVAVTRYWLRRANPEPTVLKALLMVMVQGELISQNRETTGGQQYTKHRKQLPDGVVAHSFNQWQACLKDASQLNLLLCKPLPEPHFA
ncbi:unnamed protein product [Gadus morhua 'NCC']